MSSWNVTHLEAALALAGFQKDQDLCWFTPGSEDPGWALRTHPSGFISFYRPFAVTGKQEVLALHGCWEGPVKLARHHAHLEQRFDFFIAPDLGDDPILDSEASGRFESLAAAVVRQLAREDFGPSASEWEPPATEKLLSWLSESGHSAVTDDKGHLRMTLKRHGCPGQVRIIRESGCLRLVLPLGQWEKLLPAARKSLLCLAHNENSMNRLARIVWQCEGSRCAIEAQVDLTGLPVENDLAESFSRDMLKMAVASLDLVLRQMGLEVSVLAAPENRKLANQVLALYNQGQQLKTKAKHSTL